MVANERLDYGIDAPGYLRVFAIMVAVTATAAILLGAMGFGVLSFIVSVICAFSVFCAAWWVFSSKFLKLRARDAILSRVEWRGDEHVLDIGCGHGVLLIGAAKRLTTGRATGIDLWRQVDQWDNSAENAMKNARIEGVADRVDLRTDDARKLDFPDESFDVILSSAALHDVAPTTDDRNQIVLNIIRVLKPGGRIAIYDIKHLPELQKLFIESGMEQARISEKLEWYLPFAALLTANKPGRSNT